MIEIDDAGSGSLIGGTGIGLLRSEDVYKRQGSGVLNL